MNWDSIVWLVLMVVFLVAEGSSVQVVSLWFAAGSLVAMVVSLFHGPIWLEVLIFALVSLILLALLRPIVQKFIHPKLTPTNVDSVIGACGRVTAAIDNVSATGQVKLGAMEWTARSTSCRPIPEGTLVQVDRIEGVKVFVSPVKECEKVCE